MAKIELIPKVNENHELDHYEVIRKIKSIDNKIIINEDTTAEIFHITETMSLGNKEVFKQEYTIEKELVKALHKLHI